MKSFFSNNSTASTWIFLTKPIFRKSSTSGSSLTGHRISIRVLSMRFDVRSQVRCCCSTLFDQFLDMASPESVKTNTRDSNIEWAMWANEHILITAYVLAIFSILTIIYQHALWPIGIYGLILAILMIIFEYPRSGRVVKKSRSRRFQQYPSLLLAKLGWVGRNYFLRFVTYILLSLPCLFLISTIAPALSLVIGACIYGLAALFHEQWIPVEVKPKEQTIPMPTRPPPRVPVNNRPISEL
jgi:cytochrome b-245, alpha polypeptide